MSVEVRVSSESAEGPAGVCRTSVGAARLVADHA